MSNKRITLDELHQCLVSDPYYGVWSAATESIINRVYQDNSGDAVYEQFGNHFAQTSFKRDKQRHLICPWCGLMELPTYCDGKPTRWQGPDFIDHYQKSIEIELDEFKVHLKRRKWPLPRQLFPDEPDNTEERVKKDKDEYQSAFVDGASKLDLEAKREKWRQAPTESVADLDKQEKRIAEIDRQIDEIMHGKASGEFHRDSAPEPIFSGSLFPTPKDTQWDQVVVRFIADDLIRIGTGGISKKYTFAEIGFKDGRKGNEPDAMWATLKVLAQHNGHLSWTDKTTSDNRDKYKKHIQIIRKRLKQLMQIDDDPFFPYKKSQSYRTKFLLSFPQD